MEGIVAKRSDSLYYPGKRTKDWLKCKALLDDDFVVCGYFLKERGVAAIVLGSYDGTALVYRGHVTLGMPRQDFAILERAKRVKNRKIYAAFPDEYGAIWLEPKLVCIVQYMELTPSGGLRQPVFKGLRDDKAARECVV